MFKTARMIAGAVALLAAATCGAFGTPITLGFAGTFSPYSVYDGSQQFGPNSYGNIATAANYNISLSFDTSTLVSNTCPISSINTSCQWNFGGSGITEAITINGITKSFTALTGNLQYCTNCGGNLIQINANTAGGGYFGGQFLDTTKFFSSQTNANNADLLIAFNNVSLTNGNYNSSTNAGGNLSLNTSPNNLSASVGRATEVPEPLTLSLFVAGIFGVTFIRRRKKILQA